MSSKLELLKKKPVPQKRLPVYIEIAKKRKVVNIDVTVKDMRKDTDSEEIGLKRAKMMEKMRMAPPRPLDELPITPSIY